MAKEVTIAKEGTAKALNGQFAGDTRGMQRQRTLLGLPAEVYPSPPRMNTYTLDGYRTYVSSQVREAERELNRDMADFLARKTNENVYVLPYIESTGHNAESERSRMFPLGVKEGKNPDLYYKGRFVEIKSMLKEAPENVRTAKRKIQNRLKNAFEQGEDALLIIPTSYSKGWIKDAVKGQLNSSNHTHHVYVKYGDELLIYKGKK